VTAEPARPEPTPPTGSTSHGFDSSYDVLLAPDDKRTVGGWSLERFDFTTNRDHKMVACIMALKGQIPPSPGTYVRLIGPPSRELWMSDTDQERRSHLPAVWAAKSIARTGEPVRALIAGLGLGMVARALLRIPEVTNLNVLELNRPVIDLVEARTRAAVPNPDRLRIVESDARKWKPGPDETYNLVWLDVWASVSTDELRAAGRMRGRYTRMFPGAVVMDWPNKCFGGRRRR